MIAIPLNKTQNTLIDAEDIEIVSAYVWHLRKVGKNPIFYAFAKVNGKDVGMHNLLMKPPKGFEVDHINHDGLDNRRKHNLRICTKSQNIANSRIHISNKSSKFKGVSFDKKSKKWAAYIRINYKQIHIGYFANENEAARAYDIKAKEIFGNFAFTNNIEESIIPHPIKISFTSDFRGVHWDSQTQKWRVHLKIRNKVLCGGRFNNEIEAAKAYDKMAKQYRGDEAKFNFPALMEAI
jgi:hypothetical protein